MANPMPLMSTAAPEKPVLAAIARLRDLPASAPVIQRALRCLDNPDFSTAELKGILVSDQAVAARILHLANSAYCGFRSEVRTVSQAVVLLGPTQIRTLLHRILVDKLLSGLGQGKAAAIQRVSRATAVASCMVSQMLERGDAEEILVGGLLHNIGDLFFFSQFPSQYQRLCQGEDPLEVLGMTTARAGGLLLQAWKCPPVYSAIVEHCDEPLTGNCPAEHREAAVLVHAGKKLAEAFLAGTPLPEAAEKLTPAVREFCQLDQKMIEEILVTLPQRMSLEQLQAR